ncbi:MAG TPA: hypothetical protein VNE39_02255 [Planctomycetota bacterium]|nr:hypothetical protein [Planctomycetota bacterium]
MPTRPVDAARLKALAALADADLGHSEEDLKIRFAVPFLEALGHTRLRFEHKGKDILLQDGLPRGSAVVVETKRPDVALDAHLAQLERYANEERALLAVLTNGRRVRLYAPSWRAARTFPEALLWDFARRDLARRDAVKTLATVLSREALAGERAPEAIVRRQAGLEIIWRSADTIRVRHRERRGQLERRLREIATQTRALAAEQRCCEQELGQLGPGERAELRGLFERAEAPLVPTGEFGYALPIEPVAEPTTSPTSRPKRPRRRKPPVPREWTDDDLRKNVSPYQARILEAFVLARKPTLGLRQIAEATGLATKVVCAAMAPFRYRKEYSGRDPVIVRQRVSHTDKLRTGHLYGIVPRFWPVIQRLYRPPAPRKRTKKASTD